MRRGTTAGALTFGLKFYLKISALRYELDFKFKRSRRFKTATVKFYRTLDFLARYLYLVLGICNKILALFSFINFRIFLKSLSESKFFAYCTSTSPQLCISATIRSTSYLLKLGSPGAGGLRSTIIACVWLVFKMPKERRSSCFFPALASSIA